MLSYESIIIQMSVMYNVHIMLTRVLEMIFYYFLVHKNSECNNAQQMFGYKV